MRILYLTQYFPPEIGATQIRAQEMTSALARAGHHVTVLTEVPNHPTGIVEPTFRRRPWVRRNQDGVDIVHLWVAASPNKTMRTRLAFYLSYMAGATAAGMSLARGPFDVIYATSPPLFVGGAALALQRLRRLPLVFEVRDLWPESAVTMGELRNPRFVQWATELEEACYRRASRVVVTAREIEERLLDRGVPTAKLSLIRNGANTELFRLDAEAGARVRGEWGLNDKFVALYAGLHGLAYDLERVVDVAHALRKELDIHFLLVGDGPTKPQVAAKAVALGLTNLTLVDAQPQERIAGFFNAADVSLVPMRNPHIVGTLPIKIYDSMACATPVIVGATGEARYVVEEAEAGLVVPPEDDDALCAAILRLRDDIVLRERLGRNGPRVVRERYSRQAQGAQLAALLREVAGT